MLKKQFQISAYKKLKGSGMKKVVIVLGMLSIVFGCKLAKEESEQQVVVAPKEKAVQEVVAPIKNTLRTTFDLKNVLDTIAGIRHTKDKHQDWMFDRASTLKPSLELDYKDFKVRSTSYTYKKDCVFYLHTIQHTNDTISIQRFLENAQGKRTEGYTGERILIFAMLNDKQANFIDIPANWNHVALKEELVAILYDRIDSDVIACYRTKKCEYKDLRKAN